MALRTRIKSRPVDGRIFGHEQLQLQISLDVIPDGETTRGEEGEECGIDDRAVGLDAVQRNPQLSSPDSKRKAYNLNVFV